MSYGVKIRVWGDYACFTRPEMKVERYSYDVITPSAARGILDAIYWKPSIRWVIDKIVVVNPIKFTSIRRNELTEKVSKQSVNALIEGRENVPEIISNECRTQRSATVLKDVEYGIEAHFEITEEGKRKNDADHDKHFAIVKRRLKEGKFFKQPYFGTREFSCFFEEVEELPQSKLEKGEVDLGFMLYDMEFEPSEHDNTGEVVSYSNKADAIFYRPKMIDGVIDVAKYRKEVVK